MKKSIPFCVFIFILALLLGSLGAASASELKMLDFRDKMFEESKEVQFSLGNSPDTGVMFSLWDSSMISITQINAYFYMLGIFEAGGNQAGDRSFEYLTSWLQEMKRTAQMNARNYAGVPAASIKDPGTKTHMETLKRYFNELSTLVDGELVKVAALRKASALSKQK